MSCSRLATPIRPSACGRCVTVTPVAPVPTVTAMPSARGRCASGPLSARVPALSHATRTFHRTTGNSQPHCLSPYLTISPPISAQVGSGELVYKLAKANGRSQITTLCIDCTLRRLVSGAVDGSVRMWNLRSGEIIRQLVSAKPTEVTALLHVGLPQHGGVLRLVFATGWQRSLRMWYDDDSLSRTMSLSAVSTRTQIRRSHCHVRRPVAWLVDVEHLRARTPLAARCLRHRSGATSDAILVPIRLFRRAIGRCRRRGPPPSIVTT